MKKILLFGGTGGIGRELQKHIPHNCVLIGSNDCDVVSESTVKEYFSQIPQIDFDTLIYLSVKNIDGLIHKQTAENVLEQLYVNVVGLTNVLRYATPILREKKYGRVIYVSSVLSDNPIRGTGIYSSCKSFGETLIKTYALENAKYGITANSIQLGYFDAGLTEKVPDQILGQVIKEIPLNRLGKVEELAKLIDTITETEYINGSTIRIDGGYRV